MQEHITEQELQDRLNLIESMMAEGRRSTENWGWTFVLWGAVYYLAMAWSPWGHSAWSWPVTMLIAMVVTIVVASLNTSKHPDTALGRAIGSIWIALGISLFLLFLALGLSGRLTDSHVFAAVISAVLGMANGASALILRWKVQLACAVLWWATAVATCFGTETQSTTLFVVAIFLCQIIFGIYGMLAKGGKRNPSGPVHA